MKTKNIPFDLETAKKIQAGEIEGKIKTNTGCSVRIICWDRKEHYAGPIVALYDNDKEELPLFCNTNGKEAYSSHVIVLEVPDNEPQFKPFDKVLVRMCDEEVWRISLYGFKRENGTHSCINTSCWEQCIPYEGNEYLVGTTDKPKED